MQREDIKMFVKNWWDIYNDESLDYKKLPPAADGDQAEAVNMQPFLSALSEAACAIQYVAAPSAA
jgi:inositol 3-alpha-galactosyltransferase